VCGRRIREARRRAIPRLSQAGLARGASRYGAALNQSAVSRIENRVRTLNDYELIAIARFLRVSLDSLCGIR
jgi:hypothetical protein